MTDKVSFVSNEDIEKKIKLILGQTDYTEEFAKEMLENNNYNEISVIKGYFGIAEKKAPEISSLNQEIYRQIRYKLDASMKDYNTKKNNNP
jgi:hypothetical protein